MLERLKNDLLPAALCLTSLLAAHALVGGQQTPAGPMPNPPASAVAAERCSPPQELVEAAYLQILERPASREEVEEKSAKLTRAELSVKGLVRELAHSDEYKEKFVTPNPAAQAVSLLYQHLLARGGEPGEFEKWGASVAAAVDGIMGGAEYNSAFGERGVPGRPLKFRACNFPVTLRQHDVLGNGQHTTTEVSMTETGVLEAVTKLNNLVLQGGFCAKVGVWLFDDYGNVIDKTGPPRAHVWCVEGRSTGNHERTESWRVEIPPEQLRRAHSLSILHAVGGKDPFDMTGANAEQARRAKQSLK